MHGDWFQQPTQMKLFLGHWTILLPIYFVWRAKLVIPQNLEVDVLELSDHSVNGTLQQPDRGVLLVSRQPSLIALWRNRMDES